MTTLNLVRRILTAFVVAVALIASTVSPAQSAALVPGSVLLPAAAEPDPVGATLLASTGAVPVVVPGAFTGTLTTSVYSPDPSNPLGGLTFTYLLANDASSANSIGRLTVGDFLGFSTDANYQFPVAGVAPASIDRNVAGDVVGFNFVPTPIDPSTGFLSPGATSARLVVQTNAPFFMPSTANLIDGGVTTVASLGPAIVPEPSTVALTIGALTTLGVARRRRR